MVCVNKGLKKLKTNLMMIRTETNLKYILIIKLIKIVIAKAIKIIEKRTLN